MTGNRKDVWVIESVSRLHTDPHLKELYGLLMDRDKDIISLFNDDDLYFRATIDCYYRFTFKRFKTKTYSAYRDKFCKQFLHDLINFPTWFKAFDLVIFLDQRDTRNSFVFKRFFKKVDLNTYIPRFDFYNQLKFLDVLKRIAPRRLSNEQLQQWKDIVTVSETILNS